MENFLWGGIEIWTKLAVICRMSIFIVFDSHCNMVSVTKSKWTNAIRMKQRSLPKSLMVSMTHYFQIIEKKGLWIGRERIRNPAISVLTYLETSKFYCWILEDWIFWKSRSVKEIQSTCCTCTCSGVTTHNFYLEGTWISTYDSLTCLIS